MLVRYLPVILVLTALVLALAPLETAGQSSSSPSPSDTGQAQGAHKADRPRPRTGGAPVNANAAKAPLPPGADARQVRPAQAFPPERIAPSNVQALDSAEASPARKDDPRSVEERADPGG
jgi:hypothetical protein